MTVPTGAVDRFTGRWRGRGRRRLGQDTRSRWGRHVEDDAIHGLAEGANLNTEILHG